jgi:hypothetical protein
MVTYVTHCDRKYASRAIAMVKSLRMYDADSRILVIYQDIETQNAFSKFELGNIDLIHINHLTRAFPELEESKTNRTLIEFYYCLTPFVLKFCQMKYPKTSVVYVDADIYFFKNPMLVLQNLPRDYSAYIVQHRFKEKDLYLEKYGKFNVGIVIINALTENKLLEWWAESCVNSTSIVPTENSFGDQKYLDEFERMDSNVFASSNHGENVAPWNLDKSDLSSGPDGPLILNSELIYYHFSGLKLFLGLVSMGFAGYSKRPGRRIWKEIYKPYLTHLNKIEKATKLNSRNQYTTLSLKLWMREIYYFDLRLNFYC